MFEKEVLIEECRTALKKQSSHSAIRELLAHAVAKPSEIIQSLGEPKLAGIETIYHADDLTILNIVWGPHMSLFPHNHEMWAVIGIYGGREENIFYKRSDKGLLKQGSTELNSKDTIPLADNVIHAVRNPLDKLTAAIHIYGGDFFAATRSEWNPETLEERPYNIEHVKEVFAQSNKEIN